MDLDAMLGRPSHAPGPRGLPLVGIAHRVMRDPLAWVIDAARYGDVVELLAAGKRIYQLNHPDLVDHVLKTEHRGFGKQTIVWDAFRLFLGEGLLTSEGDFWLRQRRIAQPAFHRQRLAGFVDLFARATRDMLDRFTPGRELDVVRETTRLTMRIVGEALLSTDPSRDADELGRALTVLLAFPDARMKLPVPIPLSVPLPMHRRFLEARAVVDRIVHGIIEARRRDGGDRGDLLSMLMLARDEETGETMSDRQLRDEVLTIFLAGHETTATALAWTFLALSRHPEVRRKLRAEVLEVLGDRAPTFEDLPKLKLGRRVLDESLRLHPPAWITGRHAATDCVVGGVRVTQGSILQISPYVLHRDARFWPNPEGFDPDRFLPEAEKTRPRLAYIPFGAGPRLCIGNQFALMEAVTVLAMTAQRFDLDLVPGQTIVPAPAITLRPRDGIRMIARAV